MSNNNDLKIFLNKAAVYCSRSEKCEQEVRNKLKEWNVDIEFCDIIIDYLTVNKFIDNTRYAKAYVNDAIKLKEWGRIKIGVMLRSKGIPSWVIDAAMGDIDMAEYRSIILKQLKIRLKGRGGNELDRQKILRSMYSRGYETDIVIDLINSEL